MTSRGGDEGFLQMTGTAFVRTFKGPVPIIYPDAQGCPRRGIPCCAGCSTALRSGAEDNTMSAQREPPFFTLEEYFGLERASERRWEYRHGEIVCRSGGSRE